VCNFVCAMYLLYLKSDLSNSALNIHINLKLTICIMRPIWLKASHKSPSSVLYHATSQFHIGCYMHSVCKVIHPRYSKHWTCLLPALNVKSCFKSWLISFTVQGFLVQIHSIFNWKFKNKILFKVSGFYLMYNQPETDPFLSAQNDCAEHLFSSVYM
jgi:hypothetical protein